MIYPRAKSSTDFGKVFCASNTAHRKMNTDTKKPRPERADTTTAKSDVDGPLAALRAAAAGGPGELLAAALGRFGHRLAVVTALQSEGMALVDMAWRIDPDVRVITLDTGRLPDETYRFIDEVREHYGLTVEIWLPEGRRVQRLVQEHGPNLFYRSTEARRACCTARKVEPLGRALATLDAWVTGLRRDQTPSRAAVEEVELDRGHGDVIKLNPLARWSADRVSDYVERHRVPVHPLYAQGYTSIGCAPCTRATRPGEDPRAGRWWWETDGQRECGLHLPPADPPSVVLGGRAE